MSSNARVPGRYAPDLVFPLGADAHGGAAVGADLPLDAQAAGHVDFTVAAESSVFAPARTPTLMRSLM